MIKQALAKPAAALRKIAAHVMRRTITEIEWIPEHDEREASEEYLANRHQLIEVEGIGCWYCGTHDELEAHHWFEWAEWNAEDAEDCSKDLAKLDFHGYGHLCESAPIDSPDAISNLCILCRTHHRKRGHGIHNTTGPVWWAGKARRAGMHITRDISP